MFLNKAFEMMANLFGFERPVEKNLNFYSILLLLHMYIYLLVARGDQLCKGAMKIFKISVGFVSRPQMEKH